MNPLTTLDHYLDRVKEISQFHTVPDGITDSNVDFMIKNPTVFHDSFTFIGMLLHYFLTQKRDPVATMDTFRNYQICVQCMAWLKMHEAPLSKPAPNQPQQPVTHARTREIVEIFHDMYFYTLVLFFVSVFGHRQVYLFSRLTLFPFFFAQTFFLVSLEHRT
jgi:hypothetical protein